MSKHIILTLCKSFTYKPGVLESPKPMSGIKGEKPTSVISLDEGRCYTTEDEIQEFRERFIKRLTHSEKESE